MSAGPKPLLARPMAFISDVHGNLRALDAVLDAIKEQGVEDIFAIGDHVLGGPEPLAVWRKMVQAGVRCTRGTSDRALASIDPESLQPSNEQERLQAERFARTRDELGDLVIAQLKRLPEQVRMPLVNGSELLMLHGAPADPFAELSHDLSDDEVLALIADDPADVIVCGSTHVPFDRVVDEIRVVNVGSVGSSPEGSIAHYTVIRPSMQGVDVEQRFVEFDEVEMPRSATL